jgi:hypothetical protein
MKHRASETEWAIRFESWQSSGLSQAEWCSANGVNRKTFENARTKFRKIPDLGGTKKIRPKVQHDKNFQAPNLVQLIVADEPLVSSPTNSQASTRNSSGVSICAGSLRIELAPDFDVAVLMRVLAIFKSHHD